MRESLYRIYWKLESFLAPGLESSQHEYERTLERLVGPATKWLDLGCGRTILPDWRASQEEELVRRAASVVGIDYDLGSLRDNNSTDKLARADVSLLPFRDGVFDLISANMVVEHLEDPARQFREISRVLAPGGVFVFHTPNAWGYPVATARCLPDVAKVKLAKLLDGRDEEDVFPTWYLANTPASIGRHAEAAGMSVVECHLVETSASFAVVPPLAAIELLWIRLSRLRSLARFRPDLIAVLRRA